ncbi:hypothetical protein MOK15_15050 [Sphingobium sp. BYY-5]|uniref:hypothetical protein n=1 Tax=Sphingobium sp. BYY-5 TaxID=2926400 RepID=UPI001FA6FFBA|nr:hypothetical protein [Sphingobium sp. BYY-5]MCI4591402.1 hypothetical protein [Sphingobium sp. BYY-5]
MSGFPVLFPLLLPGIVWAADEDELMAAYRAKTQVVKPCDRSGGGIVVCGNRGERNAKERLPLPREAESSGIVKGDAPRASAAPVRQGACGVSGGQGAGCTGGLPVLQAVGILVKAATAIIDPDADLSPPPALPERATGARQY